MNSKFLIGTLFIVAAGMPFVAGAAENECADCAPVPVETAVDPLANEPSQFTQSTQSIEAITVVAAPVKACGNSTGAGLVKSAADLNDKVKPLRDVVGYIRSPQGLAIKLVNDHIVSIPAWVGYAMDPVGSLKSKALDEVRTRAKDVLKSANACTDTPVAEPAAIGAKEIAIPDQSI